MKQRTVLFMSSGLLLLALALSAVPAAEDGEHQPPRLTGKIEYVYAGHLEQYDAAGRKLLWEATLTGDLSGTMKWWFAMPGPSEPVTYNGGSVNYYVARWEVWHGERLVLAGESSGKTAFPDGQDGVWDGAGVVTQARGKYTALEGRHIYETGPVMLDGLPHGTGIFSVF